MGDFGFRASGLGSRKTMSGSISMKRGKGCEIWGPRPETEGIGLTA